MPPFIIFSLRFFERSFGELSSGGPEILCDNMDQSFTDALM